MLKDNFFSISSLSCQEGNVNAEISLNPDHTIYEGHFPNNPVTPGVCQIQIVRDVLSQVLNQQVFLSEAKNIKFLNVLLPSETELKLKLEYSEIDLGYKTKAVLLSGEKIFLKFTGQFRTYLNELSK